MGYKGNQQLQGVRGIKDDSLNYYNFKSKKSPFLSSFVWFSRFSTACVAIGRPLHFTLQLQPIFLVIKLKYCYHTLLRYKFLVRNISQQKKRSSAHELFFPAPVLNRSNSIHNHL